jgi:ABC-type phosphate transport system substrate-binding protein
MSQIYLLELLSAKNGDIDAVMPNTQTIGNESYPVTNHLFMITKEVPDTAEAKYLRFLTSADGQALLGKSDLVVPLR